MSAQAPWASFSVSIPPSLTDWFTLVVAITFSVTGLLLLVAGWLTLPRSPKRDRPSAFAALGGSETGRTLGGVLLAIAGIVVTAYSLTHEHTLLHVGGLLAGGLFAGLVLLGRTFYHLVSASDVWTISVLYPGLAGWAPLIEARHLLLDSWAYRSLAVQNAIVLVITAVLGGIAGWLSAPARWSASGVITFLGVEFLALGLVGFSLLAIESAHGLIAQGLGLWLVGIELFGFFLFIAYQFYSLEYLTGRARAGRGTALPPDPHWVPKVLVQVAAYNEPPGIVENCLESTLRLDYPQERFAVQLLDDSTDAGTVGRLQRFCASRGIDYRHREDRRGFKGGALNDGLAAVTTAVDLVAIVDSDYVVQPTFLRIAVQPFRAPEVGFVQTPQAYRNAIPGTFARWYALADAYFYRVVQPVRARARSLLFCGTMGLVRVKALRAAGGWSETCVTEDAELSLRLTAAGWRGEYVPTTLGWGLAPEELSVVRSQHRRWAFGGLQMLRMNREKLESAPLSLRQRLDYKMSALFWTDGIFLLGVTAGLTALVAATWFGIALSVNSTAAVAILAAAPLLLMVDGLTKIRIALRATTPVTLRDTFGIIAFWYAIKLNDLRAALRGWHGRSMGFHRTPKEGRERPARGAALRAALRDTALETTVSITVASVAVTTAYRWRWFSGVLPSWESAALIAWLGYYSLAFASAPVFDYLSQRAAVAVPSAAARRPTGRTGPAVAG